MCMYIYIYNIGRPQAQGGGGGPHGSLRCGQLPHAGPAPGPRVAVVTLTVRAAPPPAQRMVPDAICVYSYICTYIHIHICRSLKI